ncbi:MAG TPA: transposase [Gammaproteobacteria bacterium]|nr:transposase [Gammaproteobacteria bacterium]
MRTPKPLYAQQRRIYHSELLTCPSCGDLLVGCNYLAWDKTVQTLDQVLSIASRPAHCPRPTCPGFEMRLLSAHGQRLAIANSTYGYDVLARIGWLRKTYQATDDQIQADLSRQIRISTSHVRYLYQQIYLPLLACHQRQQHHRLGQVARQQGGIIIALDGLEPEAGEPQLWFVRDLLTGLTLRSGWLAQQSQAAFEAFLAPLRRLDWPILAILSDKQTGLVPAVASVFPKRPHQFCQAHYLRNLATPLADADTAFKSEVRKSVRDQVGSLIRQEAIAGDAPNGVLTVTGILPELSADPPLAPWAASEGLGRERGDTAKADELVNHLFAPTRYLLTLKGRPPFRLAGLETYERLQGIVGLSFDLLTHRLDLRLVKLYQGLKEALAPFAQTYAELQQGAVWLRDIADILALSAEPGLRAKQVAGHLSGYLDALYHQRNLSPLLHAFSEHLDTVSQSYWPGLFHCYEVAGLAQTNNGLESHFRDTQRRLLRTTGQKGQTKRTLHRLGAWELLDRPLTEAEAVEVLSHIPAEDFAKERQRLYHHRQRFRFQMRSLNGSEAQLEKLRQQWQELPKMPAG